MRSCRLLALLVGALVVAAACGGSAAQRDALDIHSQAGDRAAPQVGEGTTGDATSTAGDDASGVPEAATPADAASGAADAGRSRASSGASARAAKTDSPDADRRSGQVGGAPSASPSPTPGATVPDTPEEPQAATGGATDVGVTANSIKVGHIGVYSGPVGSFGDDLSYAARATLQHFNDSGGINGRKFDVLVRDDAWDSTKGMNAGRDLVERHKVFAMCCVQSVNSSDPLTPYLDEKKVPHVGADGWGEPQYEGEWTFPVGASAVVEAHMLAKYQAEEQGAKRVAIIYIDNPTGRAYVQAYDDVIKRYGGEVVFSQPATFDDPGTTTFIAQARAQDVDTISAYLDPGIFARMVREAAAQSYKPRNGFSGGAILYFEATPNFTGPWGEGTIAATHWETNDMDSPGLRTYRELVEQYYPDIDHSSWTKAGYVGANLFGNTLKKLGLDVTRKRLKDDLDRLTDFDTGLGVNLTFRPDDRRANKTIYLSQIQRSGDKFEYKYLAGPLVDEFAAD